MNFAGITRHEELEMKDGNREREQAARGPLRRRLWAPPAGVALASVLVTFGIDSFGQADRAQPADAIVVLGARVLKGGRAGDSLRARTLHAVELYHRGFAPAIMCTGGVGAHAPAEAEVAAALARSHGVPAGALVLEDRSTSTWENAENAAALCRERRWQRVIVVSDPYHLLRATRNFRKVGLEAYPSPARECRRNRTPYLRALWAFREGVLILRDFLMGKA